MPEVSPTPPTPKNLKGRELQTQPRHLLVPFTPHPALPTQPSRLVPVQQCSESGSWAAAALPFKPGQFTEQFLGHRLRDAWQIDLFNGSVRAAGPRSNGMWWFRSQDERNSWPQPDPLLLSLSCFNKCCHVIYTICCSRS